MVLKPEKIFDEPWSFSEAYIRQNHIQKIFLHILDKKDFQSPEDRNRQEVFEFDANGKEIFSYTVQPVGITTQTFMVYKGRRRIPVVNEKTVYLTDTLLRQSFYNPDGTLKLVRNLKKNFYSNTSYFHHYPDGWVKEIRCKEWPSYVQGREFILEKQEVMFTDSVQNVTVSENFKKKIFYNSDHVPYKEWHYEYAEGNLTKIREVFLSAPWMEQYRMFEYKDNRLSRATWYVNTGHPFEMEYEYQYDNRGNIYTILYRKNKFLEKEIGFVNDSFTGNPHSIVIRDYRTKSLQIIRLQVISAKSPFADIPEK